MNDNEPLAQLLEETRQTNRLLCRQLTWSRILAVVLAVIAAAAVVLAVRLGGELLLQHSQVIALQRSRCKQKSPSLRRAPELCGKRAKLTSR